MELYVYSALLSVNVEKHHLGEIRGPRMFKYLWILIILFALFVICLYLAYCVMDVIEKYGAKTLGEIIERIWLYHDDFLFPVILCGSIGLGIVAFISFIYYCGGLK